MSNMQATLRALPGRTESLTEALDEHEDEYGVARPLDVLRANADEAPTVMIARVLESIDAFAGDAPQFADLTLLAMKRA
jgi:phosphoserine phosphatase RsbU/P